MVSGNPPRHSKSTPESVTIDLKAEEMNESVDAETASKSDGEVDITDGSGEPVPPETSEEISSEQEETAPEPAADVTADGDSDPEPLTQTSRADPRPAAGEGIEEKPRRSGSLISAALLGGVVALLGAGGLQYAGILASLGQNSALVDANDKLSEELAGLKAEIAGLPKPVAVDLSGIDTKIADLDARIAQLPMADGTTADGMTRIAALSDQMAAMDSRVAEVTDQAAKARAALEMRLEAAEKKISEPRDDVDVARAIASAGLKAAIDRGGSFLSELDTLAGISPDDPAIVELKTFAATGVPSRAELLAQFPDVASAMLASLDVADPDQGLMDRLAASAMSVIKVRPVGNVEGEGPDAIIARMEVKLQNGDLKGVGLEWDSLPEPARKASEAFKAELDARIRVEDLVGSTLTRAVSGAGKQG